MRLSVTRVYGDDTGETHLAGIDLPPEAPHPRGGGRSIEVADVPVTTLALTEMRERRRAQEIHPPVRRQLVVLLQGQFEVSTSSGDRRRFGPGECLLVDDVASKGHTFEDVGSEPLITIQAGIDAAWKWPGAGLPAGSDEHDEVPRVVAVSVEIPVTAERIFALIADPAQHPRWDGNDNLATAPPGQRVHAAGDVFTMTLTKGSVRENHVVEFKEGRRIAWRPAEPGQQPPGHLWRWELDPIDSSRTRVTHTYDWSELIDKHRIRRARATTADKLRASLDRLAALAQDE